MEDLINKIKKLYPNIKLYVYEYPNKIELNSIVVPEESRRKGIGSSIIEMIKDYAYEVEKPIVIEPSAERGYKQKLDKFYKNLGFVHNTGRNKDFTLSKTFGPTMYWKPNISFKKFMEKQT